jgi:hypothetical protein
MEQIDVVKDLYAFRQVTMTKVTGPLRIRAGSSYWMPNTIPKVYEFLSGNIL